VIDHWCGARLVREVVERRASADGQAASEQLLHAASFYYGVPLPTHRNQAESDDLNWSILERCIDP
jgi:hypothetical protein